MGIFTDKILLVTGGTGTFGNAIIKKFINTDIKEIRIFSRDENKQEQQRLYYKNKKLKYYLGDVRNVASIEKAIYGVDYIFHAAALKQVHSCEFFPLEAINTNVLGTDNVLTSAINNNVKKVILLSTDKAAYPISVMGMTKALMEKIMISKIQQDTRNTVFCATRYGNVMCSRGSVIPLFVNQLKNGQSITLTNPNMTRFMMSVDEAIDLVLFAFEYGENGDIFVQKSPATNMLTLSEALRELFHSNNSIKTIGTRHGEKVYETLVTKEEMVKAIDMDNYYKIPPDKRTLDYGIYTEIGQEKQPTQEYNSDNTIQLNLEQTKDLLLSLEYVKEQLR